MSQRSPPATDPAGMSLPGMGSPRPTPRVLKSGFFGVVPDAFDGKSLNFSEQSPRTKRKLQLEAERKKREEEEEKKNGHDEAPPVEETVKPEVATSVDATPWNGDPVSVHQLSLHF